MQRLLYIKYNTFVKDSHASTHTKNKWWIEYGKWIVYCLAEMFWCMIFEKNSL